jgi:hypothetical protein
MRIDSEDRYPVHDAHPLSFLKGTDPKQLKEWNDHDSRKLFAIPFDGEARTPNGQNSVRSKLAKAIHNLTKSPEAMVAAPRTNVNSGQKRDTPTTFLIYNLDEHGYDLLKDNPIWCSEEITFRTVPFNAPCPDFLFAIEGMNTTQNSAVQEVVHQIWHDEHTAQFLESTINRLQGAERAEAEDTIPKFIASMKTQSVNIKEAGNTPAPRYSVLVKGATITNDNLWTALRNFFLKRTYAFPMQGEGTTNKSPNHCGICHGVDHPRGLCPFPNIEGWRGPIHRPIQDTNLGPNGGRPAARAFRP